MTTSSKADVVICGAGASGLATAIHIIKHSPTSTIEIIDPDFSKTTPKTWCFWDEKVSPVKDLIKKSWSKISVIDSTTEHKETFNDPVYFCITADDYRNKLIAQLKSLSRVNLNQDSVSKIDSDNNIYTDGGNTITANYVVDSRFSSIDEIDFHPSANTLWQHFKGWVIETSEPIFDPEHAILMDFRVPQSSGFAFVYLLPYSETRALVELTYFNKEIPQKDSYDPILEDYLQVHWNLKPEATRSALNYVILDTEYGIIPMTDLPIIQQYADFQVKTGLSGGLAKASTGYAFSRNQRHAAILAKLIAESSPMKCWKSPFRFQYYDMLILHLLKTDPSHCVQIFMDLFGKNGFRLVFDFLDEKTDIAQEVNIMSSVPSYFAFFRAIWATRDKIRHLG
jgi:lycopene beta-cyclase